ncbi:Enantiomer selective amidase [Modestobacter italicus]|uniref:Enantiomer selective amidase n=1 Tax=Modestobacter italicus (strain DSM 44449 / CECT 9708 / BC 501) TaxID=2732864 RepID=I4EU83_MODI5|nr:amidase family protein [Modestobacter marinus]CCH86946.1 Enantiomer selective amidase [Modestobacter marinus]
MRHVVDDGRAVAPRSLAGRDGTGLLAELAEGSVSAEELLEEHVRLLTGPGSALGAVVDADVPAARRAAAEVDRRRARGEQLPALAGLPVTIKDSFDAAGLRTSHGRLSDARPATVDAPLVRRVRAAGAVVLGKTSVPVYLDDHQASTELGTARNPHDLDRTPGGSSSGAGAAVAAGLSVADFGSDLAGSLRVPSAWCGLFGHRPSNGIVSKLGHMPWPQGGLLEPAVSSVGPMVRSARDLELFLDVLVGVEGPATRAWRLELPPPSVDALDQVRVAVWLDDPAAPVDAETRAALTGFADRLADAGCRVEELTDAPVAGQAALDLFTRLQAGEVVHGLDEAAWQASRELAARAGDEPDVLAARRSVQTLRDALDDREDQWATVTRWDRVFDRVDVVLCPAVPCAAPALSDVPASRRTLELDGRVLPAADTVWAWSRLTGIGMGPATVAPVGRGARSGLPIGAQLLGRYLDDRTPLRVAALLEEAGVLRFEPPAGW